MISLRTDNPFRRKWVFSLKQGFTSAPATLQYRARAYVEADDIVAGANSWTHMYSGPNGTHAWASADLNDPPWPYNKSLPAQLYNLNCNAVESVMVCMFAIFRGFVNPAALAPCEQAALVGSLDEDRGVHRLLGLKNQN